LTVASLQMNQDTAPNNGSNTDFVTRTAVQTLSGTLSANVSAGETVFVSVNDGASWSAATAAVGQNTWSLAGVTLSGSQHIRVKVSDVAGNETAALRQSYVLDQQPPSTLITGAAFSQDTAPNSGSNSDFVTRLNSQTITATLSAALVAGETLWASLNNGTTWTDVTSLVTLVGGVNTLTWTNQTLTGTGSTLHLKVSDLAGNESQVYRQLYVLDTQAPSAPTGVSVIAAGGTVESNALNKTNSAAIFSANIVADQATGGAAYFYVGSTLVGMDSDIGATDTSVSAAITSNLQTAIAAGGVVSVQLFDRAGNLVTGTGPTLAVRYNDAPVLDASKSPRMTSIDTTSLSAAPSGAVGTLVSDLVNKTGIANVSDVDTANAVGLAITGYNTSKGTLYYSTNGGTNWSGWYPSGSNALHLLADASTRVYFRASAGATGDAGLVMRAWDASNGVANGAAAVIAGTGGSHAYSAATDTVGLALFTLAHTPGGLSASFAGDGYLSGWIGNFNGDGFMDVGGGQSPNGNTQLIRLRWGKAGALSTTADATAAPVGHATSQTLLDINGDGYGDLVFGSNAAANTAFGYVLGNAAGTLSTPTVVNTTWKPGMVKGSGDFNGDGFDDVVVINSYDVFGGATPTVQIYAGRATGAPTLSVTYSGVSSSWSGTGYDLMNGVAYLGDTNRDGMSDLAISNSTAGQVMVKLGTTSTSGWATPTPGTATGWVVSGLTVRTGNSDLGLGVASAGDVNGDGLSDLLVLDPQARSAYVIYGQANGSMVNLNVGSLSLSQGFKISTTNTTWNFAVDGGTVGDVNADGYDDVVIGANGMSTLGGAVVVFGGPSLAHGNLDVQSAGSWARTFNFSTLHSTNSSVGLTVSSTPGDVNGDGLNEILLNGGHPNHQTLIYGDSNMAAGLSLNPLISGSFAVGTAAAERLLGTAGNDTLFTGGGADAVSAGAGNDTVLVRDTSFVRIDGGLGLDTFKLDSTVSNMTLDLSLLGDKVKGFEHFDLTGGGNNTLRITMRDLMQMPDAVNRDLTTANINESQMVLVTGNAGDRIEVNFAGTWNLQNLTAADQNALAGAGYQFEAGRSYKYALVANFNNGHALIYDSAIDFALATFP
jgi:RTX calcium-binding nonapeptide repeat (4 copies)